MSGTIIGYCRVSTDDQKDGMSIPDQEDRLRKWASIHDHEVAAIYTDPGKSGGSRVGRDGLAAAMEHAMRLVAERGGSGSVIFSIYSASRLARNTRDWHNIFGELTDAGVQLAIIDMGVDPSTPAGQMVAGILALFSDWQRRDTIERTRMAISQKRERREALGNTPYGWRNSNPGRTLRKDGRYERPGLLEPVETEQKGVRLLLELAERGDLSYAAIARRLDEAGAPTRSGKPWDRGFVRRLIQFYRSQRGRALLDEQAARRGGDEQIAA